MGENWVPDALQIVLVQYLEHDALGVGWPVDGGWMVVGGWWWWWLLREGEKYTFSGREGGAVRLG